MLLLLGGGAVAVVEMARSQMALETAASAAALVAARGVDASQACLEAHQELAAVLGVCVGNGRSSWENRGQV